MAKYFSRKFILTLLILGISTAAPVLYKNAGVSDMVALAVLGIIGGIGAAYHIANVKDGANPPK